MNPETAASLGLYYGWANNNGNPFRSSGGGNPFVTGSRSRGINQQDQSSGSPTRASGGFGAPIQPPGGGRSRINQQDQPTPTGGPQSVSPYTMPQDITNALGGNPPAVPTPRPAPTTAQVQENPGQWAGTSFDPTRNIFGNPPTGGANSLPFGSENVGGVGMYTGANGPSMAGSDPLRSIRSLDQVNYYKYVLPWQQGGGNINDENAVRAAMESGIRNAGGGSYWGAWGGAPYQQYRVS